MEKSSKTTKQVTVEVNNEPSETCGIVMPISAIDGCDEAHWANVLEILHEAVREAGFRPSLVSASVDIGVIQTRIVQNLYENPIVVCDVSGKNPNVMFELGMRLAFDKPVIIIKDDATSYSFDTSPIEHLEYRRDLRYQNVVEFQKQLTAKIKATVEKSRKDEDYSPFLRHFGKFTVAKLDTKELSGNEYLIKRMDQLQQSMTEMVGYIGSKSAAAQVSPNAGVPANVAAGNIDRIGFFRRNNKLDELSATQLRNLTNTEKEKWVRISISDYLDKLSDDDILNNRVDVLPLVDRVASLDIPAGTLMGLVKEHMAERVSKIKGDGASS